MTDTANMQQLREVLRPLALHESDFAAGDAVGGRIGELKIAIDAFEASAEPWLLEWLGDEHYKGAVLYAAGKMNWNHEQQGKGSFADRQMRARIISRFMGRSACDTTYSVRERAARRCISSRMAIRVSPVQAGSRSEQLGSCSTHVFAYDMTSACAPASVNHPALRQFVRSLGTAMRGTPEKVPALGED